MVYLNIEGNKPVKPNTVTVRPRIFSSINGVIEVK